MTLSQAYRQAQAAHWGQPCLDYPYLSLPDIEEDTIEDTFWNECCLVSMMQEEEIHRQELAYDAYIQN